LNYRRFFFLFLGFAWEHKGQSAGRACRGYREKPAAGGIAMGLSDAIVPFVLFSLAYALLFSAARSNRSEEEISQGYQQLSEKDVRKRDSAHTLRGEASVIKMPLDRESAPGASFQMLRHGERGTSEPEKLLRL